MQQFRLATRGLCADVVRLALAEHEFVTSETVNAETRRALVERIGLSETLVAEVEHFLRAQQVAAEARQIPEVAAEARQIPDVGIREKQDLKVLATALAAQADVFVTGDRGFQIVSRDIPIRAAAAHQWEELTRPNRRVERKDLA